VDAVDLLILALRLVFVALLYLFLVFVLRVAARGLRQPAATPVRTAQAQQLRLRVLEPGATDLAAGELVAVPDGATLGRGDGADLVLADTAVSAEHARLQRAGRGWTVTDLGSTNGTRVNDAVVRKQARLADGDVLTLGPVRFQVVAR
jgi:pSer/pThr/pTyr-binding forkhead associated (FHA) protein